ncbi:hypothetical protein STEG23_015510 [Scotinomys teguina]
MASDGVRKQFWKRSNSKVPGRLYSFDSNRKQVLPGCSLEAPELQSPSVIGYGLTPLPPLWQCSCFGWQSGNLLEGECAKACPIPSGVVQCPHTLVFHLPDARLCTGKHTLPPIHTRTMCKFSFQLPGWVTRAQRVDLLQALPASNQTEQHLVEIPSQKLPCEVKLCFIQHVYGAQHPPFDPLLHGTLLKSTPKVPTTPVKAKRVSTFQEFESNTSDAWDAGEDDDELLAMATESLNSEVVMETAHRVLRNHSQRQSQPSQKEMPEPEPEPQPIAEPPIAPSGDIRLVKSVSESHTPCPSESTSDSVPLQRSQSLPHSATVSLSGTSDPHALGGSALSKREASRLDKFKQLLAGPNTDLGIPKSVPYLSCFLSTVRNSMAPSPQSSLL